MTDRDELRRLLHARNEHPERLAEIDQAVQERFTRVLAVLVLDMSGFSRLTHRYGIVHFLAMIQRMQELVLPVVTDARHAGRLLKLIADNVYATFPDAPQALAAAREVQQRLAIANHVLPADWDLHVSIGIGYGPMLAVGDDEIYGHEMNIASKLGEDVGCGGDILLTPAAFQRLPPDTACETCAATISQLEIPYFKLS
jgi:adenylate cyclase